MKKIKDCKLKSVGWLPFDFYAGGCNTFPFGIMMCFPAGADQECHSWVEKSGQVPKCCQIEKIKILKKCCHS